MKVKLLSSSETVKNYVLVFSSGDEIVSGLYEFASQFNVEAAHFKAIGALKSSKLGWFDPASNDYKIHEINACSS